MSEREWAWGARYAPTLFESDRASRKTTAARTSSRGYQQVKGIGFCLRTAYADRQIVHKRYDVRDIRDAVGFHIGAYVIAAADVPQVFSTVDRPPIRVKLGCENKAGALGERIGSFVPVVLMDRPVGWKPVASNLFDAAGQTEEAA